MRVLLNDPPREEAEGAAGFTPLETVCREADIITFHTPLTRTGKYPTYHLADTRFFDALSARRSSSIRPGAKSWRPRP